MQLLKPAWVHHDDKPIFSVDIHPKGGRFATGGQGGHSGRVVIWNLAPVLIEADELNPKVPKMLCQMDNHLACVNIVRWSCEGHLLASGGDDKMVMIWKLTGEGSSAIFGGGGKVNMESWKCIATLNSHTGDVLDLAWAPHDAWLASSSVDNTVIIWNTRKFSEKIAVLKGHTGMVKGVTWDPVGKYIASQSDDRTLRVWRTADWSQQELITEPFEECSATTHVLRLSWSPDGQYLVSAHAMNGGGPTAQIIERDGWKQDNDFVGHRKAVTCVRFNSNILKKMAPGSPKTKQYCCCAIGSRDRSLSVWLTSLKRPLVVIKELFNDSVLDMSWSSNGLHLLACSWDGSIACISFTPQEIGQPLSVSEKNALYERMYGKSLQKGWNQSFSGSQIIENAEMLNIMEEMNSKSMPKETSTPSSSSVFTVPETIVQKETIKFSSSPPKTSDSQTTNVVVAVNKQIETRLPSGKRRITPMLLTTVSTTPTKSAELVEVPTVSADSSSAFSSSSPTKSKIVVETVKEPLKVSAAAKALLQSDNIQRMYKKPAEMQSSQMSSLLQPPGLQVNNLTCSEVPGDQPIVHYINTLENLKLPSGKTVMKRTKYNKICITNNDFSTSHGSLAKLEVYKLPDDTKLVWESYLGSMVRCLAVNRTLVIVCCDDCSINCYDIKSGARILPALLLEDVVASLSLSENGHCLVLTRTGLVYLWNFSEKKCILNRISVRGLLTTNKVSVSGCSLTNSNMPLIALSDGRAFSYSQDLSTWLMLSNPWDPLTRSGFVRAKTLPPNLPLSSLQKSAGLHSGSDGLPSGITLSFLESQIVSSSVLQSKIEYRHWLLTTVEHLLDKGPECRLRSILDDLMGPTYSSVAKSKNDTVMGISKHSLLTDALNIVKTKLPWQRLYKEYAEQISSLNN